MENKASITALMSAFGRAWHTEHEENPIFADYKAKALLTDEEYKMMSTYIHGHDSSALYPPLPIDKGSSAAQKGE